MEKGDVAKYAVIVLVFVGLAAIVLVLRPSPTGYAILEEYTTEDDCVNAGYAWENLTEQNCTTIPGCVECEPGCVIEYTEVLCETDCVESCVECEADCQEDCTGIPDCIECEPGCVESCVDVIICEPGCVEEYTEVLCEEGCLETCEECIDVVIGGQCVGDVCESVISVCNQTECVDIADGYWYGDVCNADCSGDLSTCRDLSGCSDVNGYWYDSMCNADECADDSQCASDETCSSGSCVSSDSDSDGDSGSDDDDDSGSSEDEEQTSTGEISFSGQTKILVGSGDSEGAKLTIKNTGNYYLNCEVKSENWMSSEDKINFDKGKEAEINYTVSVPAGTSAGDYFKELKVGCKGGRTDGGSEMITVTVVGTSSSVTGGAISDTDEKPEAGPGITGRVIGGTGGKVIAYIVFLGILIGAVVLVWKRHAQIRGLDGLLLRGKSWFDAKFHREQ